MTTDLGDGKIGTVLGVLDLCLRLIPQPERQYAFLQHIRDCVESRLNAAREAVAAAVRRERGKTPPPGRPSGAFAAQHSRAQTEKHNTRRLVERSESEREFGDRATPVCPLEPVIGNTHPGRERDR